PAAQVVVTPSPLSPNIGDMVTFTIAVSAPTSTPGTPTGTVDLTLAGTPITGCTALHLTPQGTATCPTSFPAAGPQAVTATYSGDATFAAGTGTVTVTVLGQPAAPTMTLQSTPASPQVAGKAVTLTATVTPPSGTTLTGSLVITAATATGTPAVIAGCTKALAAAGGASTLTCSTSSLPVGTDTLVATYAPTTGNSVSSRMPYTITAASAVTPRAGASPSASGSPATGSSPSDSSFSGLGASGSPSSSSGIPTGVAGGSGGQAASPGVSVPLVGSLGVAGLGLLGVAWRQRRRG
ncbi:MAG: Ig-like domain repeat protein, partial [Actinomycetota bacterium]|nr:Ig-like domain repeat protein [Actinomycetota bacterium]